MNEMSDIGSLTVVGSGITAISHMTVEAIGHIREADIVLHNLHGVAATHLATLNPNCVELGHLYDEGKPRAATYVQMAELILREVRAGHRVVAAFFGHPAFFSKATRRALSIAEAEGAAVAMIPGISSIDTLLADLRVHISSQGCQILSAHAIVSGRPNLATDGHLIILMPSSIGHETGPSKAGYDRARPEHLFQRLAETYGADHPCVIYTGAAIPSESAMAWRRSLGVCASPEGLQDLPAQWTLHIPPRVPAGANAPTASGPDEEADEEAPRHVEHYGPFERAAIAQLDRDGAVGRKPRAGGNAMLLKIMTRIAESPAFAATVPWLRRGFRQGG